MASVKQLKKDIRYMSEILISKAIIVSELLDDEKKIKQADALIIEASTMYNELISRANHPDGKANKQLVKKHYKAITSDLLERSKAMFLSLNKLID